MTVSNDHSVFITEPYRVYGEGDYALTDVKVIEGTDDYVELARPENRDLCQNEITFQDCLVEDLLKRGAATCNCTPIYLGNYTKQVKKVFLDLELHNQNVPVPG